MSNLPTTVLNFVNGLVPNMAAGPFSNVLAQVGRMIPGASHIMNMVSSDLIQTLFYGSVFVGSTWIQICQGRKAEAREVARIERLQRALYRLADQSQEAQQEARAALVELALDQQWVQAALNASPVQADFYAGWQEENRAALSSLGLSAEQVQYALADISGYVRDTNERARAIERRQEQQPTNDRIDQLEARLLAKMESLKPPGGPPGGGGGAADEATQRDLIAAVERVARDAAAGSMTARGVLDRETPTDLAHYLDARRQQLRSAQEEMNRRVVGLNERIDDESVQLDRELAAVAYTTGQVDRAEAALTRILAALPDDMDALNRLGWIKQLRGDLDEAVGLYERVGQLALSDSVRAVSYGNLGVIEQVRGNLDSAEAYHKRAQAIDEKLGRLEGMADGYCNLGLIERTRGNLNAAEAYHKRALAVDEKLGRLEGMADGCCNLGLIERTRGNLDAAEAYQKKALAINERLGRPVGMAANYSNLGLIERARGNLDTAEAYQKEALAIHGKLGRLEGMAANCGNLGLIERARGNLDAAEAYLKQALAINEKLGRLEGMAANYSNLGLIELARDNLEAADAYLKQALEIEKNLGRIEGMANQYGNLGTVAEQRGDLAEARRYWTFARDLFARVGIPHEIQKLEIALDGLPPE